MLAVAHLRGEHSVANYIAGGVLRGGQVLAYVCKFYAASTLLQKVQSPSMCVAASGFYIAV